MTRLSVTDLHQHREVVESMAQAGDLKYVPGGKALQRLQRAGQQVGEAIHQLDQDFKLGDSTRELGRLGKERYRAMDDEYQITDKAYAAGEQIKEQAQQRFNDWLKQQ